MLTFFNHSYANISYKNISWNLQITKESLIRESKGDITTVLWRKEKVVQSGILRWYKYRPSTNIRAKMRRPKSKLNQSYIDRNIQLLFNCHDTLTLMKKRYSRKYGLHLEHQICKFLLKKYMNATRWETKNNMERSNGLVKTSANVSHQKLWVVDSETC